MERWEKRIQKKLAAKDVTGTFGQSKAPTPSSKLVRGEKLGIKSMEVFRGSSSELRCSDSQYPCGSPGAIIPYGKGYVFVSKEVADFRQDCPTLADVQAKIAKIGKQVLAASGVFAPILMCELGARKRGIDLKIAAADAQHWWQTGMVPIRPTPMAR